MRNYKLIGPLDLDREEGLLTRASLKMTKWRNDDWDCACEANGCYVFGLRRGDKITPWYVGMTHEQAVWDEATSQRNLGIYNQVLRERAGYPVLCLLARLTPTGRAVYRDLKSEIEKVEFLLIGAALDENPDLMNVKESQFLSELVIPGWFGAGRGKPSHAAVAFARMLGFE